MTTASEAPPELGAALARQAYRLAPLGSLSPHPRNTRRGDLPRIIESIRVLGFYGDCGVQRSSGFLIWGNHRYAAAAQAAQLIDRARSGEWVARDDAEAQLIASWASWPERFGGELDSVPVVDIDCDDETALSILLVDNASSDAATWDEQGREALLREIEERRGSLEGTGFDRATGEIRDENGAGFERPETQKLAERFLVPPFSVLDARQGYWQDRKRAWLALGIRSELGRPRNLLKFSETVLESQRHSLPNGSMPASDSGNDPQFYRKKQQAEQRLGHEITTEEFLAEHYEGPDTYIEGTSIFDPVLAELAYRWWCPAGALVLDPFAGGSVRGIVASRLGHRYVGVDLSAAQIVANEDQADEICRADDPRPRWVQGDARSAASIAPGEYDLVFSCPPYFDLERYSDDPADLSNAASWPEFCAALDESVAQAAAMLRPGRFACFVVGNVRESTTDGRVQDLCAATVHAFEAAGLLFYNDAVLVTAVGSLAIRAARIFQTRKLGRTHQAVLTFLKPPLIDALAACGPIDIVDPAEAFGEPIE